MRGRMWFRVVSLHHNSRLLTCHHESTPRHKSGVLETNLTDAARIDFQDLLARFASRLRFPKRRINARQHRRARKGQARNQQGKAGVVADPSAWMRSRHEEAEAKVGVGLWFAQRR